MLELERLNILAGTAYAIVPARSGSKGVPDKNVRVVQGYPLMAYSIAAGLMCPGVERVIVSTDSEEYAEMARAYGAETPFLRPREISRDDSTDIKLMEHAISWLQENEGAVPEYIMHLRPTSPLRDPDIVLDALERMKRDGDATSLRSAHVSEGTPFKWFKMCDETYFTCLFDGMTPDEANSPRQNFPTAYIPDGYIDILRTDYITSTGLLHGDKVLAYVVTESVDVDTLADYERLLAAFQGGEPAVLGYLHRNFEPMKGDVVA